ncbi:hypothetical protein HDU67_003130 [Dinochytrium kinnereticum]|nr:hypothetical protein HDU67_003130 [Dinochytrium kinnereticum]
MYGDSAPAASKFLNKIKSAFRRQSISDPSDGESAKDFKSIASDGVPAPLALGSPPPAPILATQGLPSTCTQTPSHIVKSSGRAGDNIPDYEKYDFLYMQSTEYLQSTTQLARQGSLSNGPNTFAIGPRPPKQDHSKVSHPSLLLKYDQRSASIQTTEQPVEARTTKSFTRPSTISLPARKEAPPTLEADCRRMDYVKYDFLYMQSDEYLRSTSNPGTKSSLDIPGGKITPPKAPGSTMQGSSGANLSVYLQRKDTRSISASKPDVQIFRKDRQSTLTSSSARSNTCSTDLGETTGIEVTSIFEDTDLRADYEKYDMLYMQSAEYLESMTRLGSQSLEPPHGSSNASRPPGQGATPLSMLLRSKEINRTKSSSLKHKAEQDNSATADAVKSSSGSIEAGRLSEVNAQGISRKSEYVRSFSVSGSRPSSPKSVDRKVASKTRPIRKSTLSNSSHMAASNSSDMDVPFSTLPDGLRIAQVASSAGSSQERGEPQQGLGVPKHNTGPRSGPSSSTPNANVPDAVMQAVLDEFMYMRTEEYRQGVDSLS